MKKECAQEIEYECMRYETRMNSFARAFGQLESSTSIPPSPATVQCNEQREAIQAFQLEAERKRAMGISYSRRDITR